MKKLLLMMTIAALAFSPVMMSTAEAGQGHTAAAKQHKKELKKKQKKQEKKQKKKLAKHQKAKAKANV